VSNNRLSTPVSARNLLPKIEPSILDFVSQKNPRKKPAVVCTVKASAAARRKSQGIRAVVGYPDGFQLYEISAKH
jgi:hypothetical protein